jgi:N-methylhydantoinase A
MAAALRLKTIERGLDPREFVLSAFGGAGPLHAVELARLLRIPEVLIPPNPGVTSAAGLLASDLRYDVVQSVMRRLGEVEPQSMDAMFRSHEQKLQDQLAADGCDADRIDITWGTDLRYRGQGYELNVAIDERPFSHETAARVRVAFDAAHRSEFGHDFPEYEVEIVNIRLTAVGRLLDLQHQRVAAGSLEDARLGRHPVAFRIDGEIQWLETSVFERELLPVGEDIRGPAVVTQLDSTTLVPGDAVFARDQIGNLHISLVPQ